MTMPTKAYYSIVQYCPSPARAECANLGVVLFVPDRKLVLGRIERSNARAYSFFGSSKVDDVALDAAKRALAGRVRWANGRFENVDAFRRFAETRGNDLVLTEPRWVSSSDPDATIDGLFGELVGPDRRPSPHRPSSLTHLEAQFRGERFQGRVRYREPVIVPVVGRMIQADYLYRNGRHHVVIARQFPMDAGEAAQRAAMLAAEGLLLLRHLNTVLLVAAATSDAADPDEVDAAAAPTDSTETRAEAVLTRVSEVFADFQIGAYPPSRHAELVERVATEAIPLDV